jgi:hypothetical protein
MTEIVKKNKVRETIVGKDPTVVICAKQQQKKLNRRV